MNQNTEKKQGCVKLVGAGPGDAGLITVAGLGWLKRADVVVHDALVGKALLDQAAYAELIDVGKRHSDHKLQQDDINQLLATRAQAGQLVVRLKGGDPFVFGRGAEEAAYLTKRGVDVEVIPGVTAGVAVPAAAGIPVTHRQHASAVLFVTGHEDENKDEQITAHQSWADVVKAGGTLCIYMGMTRLAPIIQALQAQDLADNTPAAIVQWGTTPRQRSLRTTLGNLIDDAMKVKIWAPAIITIGEVAAIDNLPANEIQQRPMLGKRVVITRSRSQSSTLRDKLEALGAEAFEAPTIRIAPPDDAALKTIDAALKQIDVYDWIVLTSSNGVNALADRMGQLALDARHFANVKIAVVGQATAEQLKSRMNLRADLIPTTYVAEKLAEQLIKSVEGGLTNKRFLLLRADIARKKLPELLTGAGGKVEDLPIYRNLAVEQLPPHVMRQLRDGRVDWITFTSSSTVRNFIKLIGDERELLDSIRIASIGPITSATLREHQLEPTVEASPSDIEHLVDGIVEGDW